MHTIHRHTVIVFGNKESIHKLAKVLLTNSMPSYMSTPDAFISHQFSKFGLLELEHFLPNLHGHIKKRISAVAGAGEEEGRDRQSASHARLLRLRRQSKMMQKNMSSNGSSDKDTSGGDGNDDDEYNDVTHAPVVDTMHITKVAQLEYKVAYVHAYIAYKNM
jgi:hypothetical protein